MDKPCPAPEQTSQRLIWPIIDKEWRGRVILNGIVVDKERVFSSIYNPSTSSSVLLPQGLDAAMRKALCVFGVSWVCNTLRQAPASPQRCLQMQINFPHTLRPQTNSEDKLLARNATTFCSSICWRRRRRMLCFRRKKSFVCSAFVLLEILLSSIWSERKRWDASGFLWVFSSN